MKIHDHKNYDKRRREVKKQIGDKLKESLQGFKCTYRGIYKWQVPGGSLTIPIGFSDFNYIFHRYAPSWSCDLKNSRKVSINLERDEIHEALGTTKCKGGSQYG